MNRSRFGCLAACLALLVVLNSVAAAQDGLLARLDRGEHLRIAAIGTSLTDAHFNAENWFAQLGAWLASRYPSQVTLSNRAVSGTASCDLPQFDRPHGGDWQLARVLAQDNPDVIFIEFAINDAYKQFQMTPAQSRKNLKSLIDRIRAWGAEHSKPVEIIVQTMNNTGPAYAIACNDVGPYYQAWAEEAAANGLLLIDHYANWRKLYASEADHATWRSYVPDDIHPNPLGTTKVIVPEIQRVLTAQRDQAASARPANPKLVKLPFAFSGLRMENTPVVYQGRPLLVLNYRSLKPDEQETNSYLLIEDLATGQEVARFGMGYSFVSAFVNGEEMNIFGTENTNKEWTKDIYRFWSTDLKTWQHERILTRQGDEHFFNTSVCRDDQGYLIAYESNKPVQWSFRFARSKDLSHWEPVADLEFADVAGQSACACPAIRYFAPYYYVIYGVWSYQERPWKCYEYLLPTTKYTTVVARSKDLITWQVSPTRGPMLDPVEGEGINNTDADLFEWEGNTYLYYATGDQATWGTIRVAMYAGPMQQMLEAYFPANVPSITFDAKQRKYIDPPR